MKFADIHFASTLTNDPEFDLIDDEGATLGSVNVRCSFDDGTGNHLLHVVLIPPRRCKSS